MPIEVHGGKELRRAFREVGGKVAARRLKEAHREVATVASNDARLAAAGGSSLQRKMAGAIRPQATQTKAGVAFARTGAFKASGVAFWGTNKRLGWFADPKYSAYTSETQKLPPWVGNNWQAAVAGQGPHHVNDALALHVPQYVEILGDAIERAAADVGLL
jgi:hypothetical protein